MVRWGVLGSGGPDGQSEEDPLSRSVFLHVGVAKTGTTYLQRLLFANRELLRANGVLYPGSRPAAHFLASMDLRESGFGGHDYPGAKGMWAKLTAEANAYDGNTLISHETLARSRVKVIRKAVDGFDTDDVRVVLTTRDLGRQIPAVWQENVKNRNPQSYQEFLAGVLGDVPKALAVDADLADDPAAEPGGSAASVQATSGGFWRPQNLPGLVKRWAQVVGRDNVIVVTVPPKGAPRDELWKRFAAAVELPDLPYSFDLVSENVSMGSAEAELLRRVTPYVSEDVTWPTWEHRVKRRFAERTLAPLHTQGSIVVPEGWHDAVRAISEEMISRLTKSRVRVVGDLDDLRPRFAAVDGPLPDEVSDKALLDVALAALGKVVASPPEPPRTVQITSPNLVTRLRERFRRG